jgi:molybdate/tungstate transport system substrate-binding protein
MDTDRRGVSRIVAVGATAAAAVAIALGVISLSTGAKSLAQSNYSTGSMTNPFLPLITFNADAYTAETQALLNGFSATTAVPVAPTHPAGSFALAKQIVSGSQVDVFVPVALSAAAPSSLGKFSPGWAIGFASDQMVVAYSNASVSAAAAVITEYRQAAKSNASSDWNAVFTSLTSGGVKLGISDPSADPAGLRGWLVLEAAGVLYGDGNQSEYTAPLLRAQANVTGSAAANMVAPLEAGQMQFLFIYRSVAVAQHLGYFQLDHRINLGDPRLAASYALLKYTLATGPATGAPIILCMTIPTDAPDAYEAMQFVQYVVKSSGALLAPYGLQSFTPPLLYNDTAPPRFVAEMLSQGLISNGGSLGP